MGILGSLYIVIYANLWIFVVIRERKLWELIGEMSATWEFIVVRDRGKQRKGASLKELPQFGCYLYGTVDG